MNRGLKLYDKFLAGSRIYTSVEAAEMTGRCLEFMCRNRRKFRFTEKMIVQEKNALCAISRRLKKAEKALRVLTQRRQAAEILNNCSKSEMSSVFQSLDHPLTIIKNLCAFAAWCHPR